MLDRSSSFERRLEAAKGSLAQEGNEAWPNGGPAQIACRGDGSTKELAQGRACRRRIIDYLARPSAHDVYLRAISDSGRICGENRGQKQLRADWPCCSL